MATTGELPPSARAGQAFIHDPKASLFNSRKFILTLRPRAVRLTSCFCFKGGGRHRGQGADQATIPRRSGQPVRRHQILPTHPEERREAREEGSGPGDPDRGREDG